jgi:hypothetical protein
VGWAILVSIHFEKVLNCENSREKITSMEEPNPLSARSVLLIGVVLTILLVSVFHYRTSVEMAGVWVRIPAECQANGNQILKCPEYTIRWQRVDPSHLTNSIRQAFLTAEKTQTDFRRRQLVATFNDKYCPLFLCTFSRGAIKQNQIWFWLSKEGAMVQIDFGHQKPDAAWLPTDLQQALYWQITAQSGSLK